MDNSSNFPNRGGNNNNRMAFRHGLGGRRNPPPPGAGYLNTGRILGLIRNTLGMDPPGTQTSLNTVSTSIPTTTAPLHTRLMAVNPQADSPLYNGRIPPEIRDCIFEYALTEYTKTDTTSKYPESTNYTRPGYTGKRAVAISLLLTCRRVYLETCHLPAKSKEHVFWHERWPVHHERYTRVAGGAEQAYFERFTPWQLELVKEVHLFTQLFWLEDGSFFRLTQKDFMQGIEKVKITIRRGDWWYNETNQALGINPQRGNGDASQMLRDWDAEKREELIPWRESGWGCAFGNLKGLKELEMEFETSEDKVAELGKIVEKAMSWKFPLKDGMVLSTEGLRLETWKWRGPLCYWSEQCPYCLGRVTCREQRTRNTSCAEKRRLRDLGLGPECTVVSLRWRVVNGTLRAA